MLDIPNHDALLDEPLHYREQWAERDADDDDARADEFDEDVNDEETNDDDN